MKSSMFPALLVVAVLSFSTVAHGEYAFEKANYWDYELVRIRGLVDPQECARLCDTNPACKVASVHGPNAPDGAANMCVLRTAVGSRHTEQPDIMSWVKSTYVFEKANYWDYELERIPGLVDPQECARRCDTHPKCKVASVHGPNAPDGAANMCVLRTAVGSRHTEQPDIMSWIKH